MKVISTLWLLAVVGLASAQFPSFGSFGSIFTTTARPKPAKPAVVASSVVKSPTTVNTVKPTLSAAKPQVAAVAASLSNAVNVAKTSVAAQAAKSSDSLDKIITSVHAKINNVTEDATKRFAQLKERVARSETFQKLQGKVSQGVTVLKQAVDEQLQKHPSLKANIKLVSDRVAQMKKQYAPMINEGLERAKEKMATAALLLQEHLPEFEEKLHKLREDIKQAVAQKVISWGVGSI